MRGLLRSLRVCLVWTLAVVAGGLVALMGYSHFRGRYVEWAVGEGMETSVFAVLVRPGRVSVMFGLHEPESLAPYLVYTDESSYWPGTIGGTYFSGWRAWLYQRSFGEEPFREVAGVRWAFERRKLDVGEVSVPIVYLVGVVGAWPGWCLRGVVLGWRRRRRVAGGRCPGCGYDWRVSPGRCSECGEGVGGGVAG